MKLIDKLSSEKDSPMKNTNTVFTGWCTVMHPITTISLPKIEYKILDAEYTHSHEDFTSGCDDEIFQLSLEYLKEGIV